MNYITLNNGTAIPQLGFGVFRTLPGEETENSVKWAFNAGYRHIDAAMIYKNEESVGNAIKASGIERKEIFITTKLWNDDIRAGRTMEAFEESLKRLQLDYVDLYLIHWPAEGYQEAWKAMEEIYASGKVKAIGVSNFQVHHLEDLMKIASVRPAVNQIESNPYFNNQPLIDYCNQRNIAIEIYSPLGGTGKVQMGNPLFLSLAEKYGKSPAQIIIRWHLQRGVIVMPKSTHEDRIYSNFDVFDFELEDCDVKAIYELETGKRSGADPDNFNF